MKGGGTEEHLLRDVHKVCGHVETPSCRPLAGRQSGTDTVRAGAPNAGNITKCMYNSLIKIDDLAHEGVRQALACMDRSASQEGPDGLPWRT